MMDNIELNTFEMLQRGFLQTSWLFCIPIIGLLMGGLIVLFIHANLLGLVAISAGFIGIYLLDMHMSNLKRWGWEIQQERSKLYLRKDDRIFTTTHEIKGAGRGVEHWQCPLCMEWSVIESFSHGVIRCQNDKCKACFRVER